MKPTLTWPAVALTAFLTTAVLLVCVWLIDRGHAPPSLLVAPIAPLLIGGAVHLGRRLGFQEGLPEMPPHLAGAVELRIVKTLPSSAPPLGPPPTVDDLAGTTVQPAEEWHVSVPPDEPVHAREVYDDRKKK